METLDNIPLFFAGGHIGEWSEFLWSISREPLENCYIISTGNNAIGFSNKSLQEIKFKYLNEEFKSKNITFLTIRGSEDDPYYFTENFTNKFSNIKLVPDYKTFSYKNKTIQCVGGGIPPHRKTIHSSENRGVVFNESKCIPSDILITHTAPSFCFPEGITPLIEGWAEEDTNLIDDVSAERLMLDSIFNLCSPSYHIYGHFGTSKFQKINSCEHKLLSINETYELFI